MINEKRFAESFNSFWNTIMPLSNSAIKNLKTISHNANEPINTNYIKDRRALINHCAFNLYKYSIKQNKKIFSIKSNFKIIENLITLTQKQLNTFISKDFPNLDNLIDDEINEVILMAESMENFFDIHYKIKNNIKVNPKFNGCGIIKNCNGDIIINDDLYEIKATKKFFEPKDIRQLITYCALNFNSKTYNIKNVGIYNPKVGQYFKINIEDLCLLYSGKDSTVLFSNILNFISNYDIHN